jgi:uracil-DNA glycosylase
VRSRRVIAALERVHAEIRAFSLPGLVGEAVHGPAIASRIFLIGQAPGPHEGKLGRPFAWTAGRTLFAWFERALRADEPTVRSRVYISAVVRRFPGKSPGGGDRVPSREEVAACRPFIEAEIAALEPTLVIPVGRLAIAEVLGSDRLLSEVIGKQLRVSFHGTSLDVIALPHPSGASTWFKVEPGRTLLEKALRLLAHHPEVRRAFPHEEDGR